MGSEAKKKKQEKQLRKEEIEQVDEGHFDYPEMAKHLIKKHGRKIKNNHIDDLQDTLDTRQSMDRDELKHYIKKYGGVHEEIELDEISGRSADDDRKYARLKSYIDKASKQKQSADDARKYARKQGSQKDWDFHTDTVVRRARGIRKAQARLPKETENISESTRATIIHHDSNGGIHSQYVHYDGYPEHMHMLTKHHNSKEASKKLVSGKNIRSIASNGKVERFKDGKGAKYHKNSSDWKKDRNWSPESHVYYHDGKSWQHSSNHGQTFKKLQPRPARKPINFEEVGLDEFAANQVPHLAFKKQLEKHKENRKKGIKSPADKDQERAARMKRYRYAKEDADLDEAARGVKHKVHVSYNDKDGNRATANVTLHAPSKDHAKRYAVSDMTRMGRKDVRAHSARAISVHSFDMPTNNKTAALKKLNSGNVREEVELDEKVKTFDPNTHTAVYKDGNHKIIKKSDLEKYKTDGYKVRHSTTEYVKAMKKEEVEKDSGWHKIPKEYKDEYGNIIKGAHRYAKHLARKAAQKIVQKQKQKDK